MSSAGNDPLRRRSDSQAGYTLTELLVTLSVLALATALVAPRVLAPVPVREQKQAVARIADALRAARTEALLTGRETQVILDVDARLLTTLPKGRVIRLPGAIDLTVTAAQPETTGGEAGVRFFPDGVSTGIDVVLETEGANPARINVDWATGAVRTVNGDDVT